MIKYYYIQLHYTKASVNRKLTLFRPLCHAIKKTKPGKWKNV